MYHTARYKEHKVLYFLDSISGSTNRNVLMLVLNNGTLRFTKLKVLSVQALKV